MSPYDQLLDAVVHHLEALKAQGTKFVSISPETLAALSRRVETRSSKLPPAGQGPARVTPPAAQVKASAASSEHAVAPRTAAVPRSPEQKAAALADLRTRVLPCAKCGHLVAARRNVVFGVGDPNAVLMFVGEAPGMDEDAQGEPFVGRAGQLLTRIIQAMGLARDRVYIANILKCRPDTPGQTSGNRKPSAEEMETCIPHLLEQIEIIQPRVLVGLGGTALEGLIGKSAGITRLRGQWQTFRGIPLMPTFHPSFLLRPENQSKKRQVWEDMLQVMERLGLPISEKQRGYFLTHP